MGQAQAVLRVHNIIGGVFMDYLTQSNRPHRLLHHILLTDSIITTWSVGSEELRTAIMGTLNRVEWTEQLLQFVPIGYILCTHACNCEM